MIVCPGWEAPTSGAVASMPRRVSRSSAFAPVSANRTGRPPRVQTRCRYLTSRGFLGCPDDACAMVERRHLSFSVPWHLSRRVDGISLIVKSYRRPRWPCEAAEEGAAGLSLAVVRDLRGQRPAAGPGAG